MKMYQTISKLLFVTAIGTIVTLSSCKKDDPAPVPAPITPTPTVAGFVTADSNYSILLAAVKKAGLDGLLNDATKTWTVFAPNNTAFRNAGITIASIDAIAPGSTQLTNLTNTLTYHVLSTKVASSAVPASDTVKTVNGRNIYASKNGSNVFVNGVRVTTADVTVSNGVIHAIGSVLTPPSNSIAQTVSALASAPTPEFSLLLAAVSRAGLAGVLSGAGKFTVFAPTNAAFIALGAPYTTTTSINAIPTSDSAALRRTILAHVIGTNVFASDLTAGGIAPTLNTSQTLTISLTPVLGVNITGAAAANLAPISATLNNLVQTNGVIHVVSKVILP
jgi:uncharacterized surface protein with fasciclin (FAS1) repeats